MRIREFIWFPPRPSTGPSIPPTRPGWDSSFLDNVESAIIKEDWGEDRRHLATYLETNFEISLHEGKIKEHEQKEYCLWRIGKLSSWEGDPISLLAMRNNNPDKQPYVYRRIFTTDRFTVHLNDGSQIQESAPAAPTYDTPVYRSDYKMRYNFHHYLSDHEERVSERLNDFNRRQRFLLIFAALQLAHIQGSQIAIPQWYRGKYQWLLPLHISSESIDDKPDFVAALDPADKESEYFVPTILPPEWMYGVARAINERALLRTWI